ncbi:MAG TPA: UPF0175 family protein [Verrucomicrobiae bacterium]
MSVTLEISDAVVEAMRLPPPEVEARMKLELAISFYAQEILGLGKAAELAGISRQTMTETLARRHVPMHYGETELAQDLAHAREFTHRQ